MYGEMPYKRSFGLRLALMLLLRKDSRVLFSLLSIVMAAKYFMASELWFSRRLSISCCYASAPKDSAVLMPRIG